jgi:diacylglycerol kinase
MCYASAVAEAWPGIAIQRINEQVAFFSLLVATFIILVVALSYPSQILSTCIMTILVGLVVTTRYLDTY